MGPRPLVFRPRGSGWISVCVGGWPWLCSGYGITHWRRSVALLGFVLSCIVLLCSVHIMAKDIRTRTPHPSIHLSIPQASSEEPVSHPRRIGRSKKRKKTIINRLWYGIAIPGEERVRGVVGLAKLNTTFPVLANRPLGDSPMTAIL